jgi:hypothetical protein
VGGAGGQTSSATDAKPPRRRRPHRGGAGVRAKIDDDIFNYALATQKATGAAPVDSGATGERDRAARLEDAWLSIVQVIEVQRLLGDCVPRNLLSKAFGRKRAIEALRFGGDAASVHTADELAVFKACQTEKPAGEGGMRMETFASFVQYCDLKGWGVSETEFD